MLNHQQAPLFEALHKHKQSKSINLHVPGHKGGQAFDREGRIYFESILAIDATEVLGLDDLHAPAGVIAEAQRLAADAFGAEHTLFLVGGSTVGNLATILTLCKPGDPILIQRQCHQSVFHGCLLAGARPIYLHAIDEEAGGERPITIQELEQKIQQYPDIKAVFLTSPSYFGWVQPVADLAQICHRYRIPLVVDEAHGAHFGFHPDFPKSAMQSGADVAIQSTHKMLTSMTMSSMLHVQGELIKVEEIARWLRIIESSSPSYPLMASLDLARRYWMVEGRQRLGYMVELLSNWRRRLQLAWLTEWRLPGPNDPFKLNIQAYSSVSGFRLAKILEKEGCLAEMADFEKVLFCFSTGTTESDLIRLEQQLQDLDERVASMKKLTRPLPAYPTSLPPSISLAEVKTRRQRVIPLNQAKNQIAAEMMVPYPPGIPLLHIGECWTAELIEYVEQILKLGGEVRGLHNTIGPHVSVLE